MYSSAGSVAFRPIWATLKMYQDCTFRQLTPSSERQLLPVLFDTCTSLLYFALCIGSSSSHLLIFLSLLHTRQRYLERTSKRLFPPLPNLLSFLLCWVLSSSKRDHMMWRSMDGCSSRRPPTFLSLPCCQFRGPAAWFCPTLSQSSSDWGMA
ncbi:hypothetical protein J3F83DRAFT_113427 [Trichoderma novae-zelandiae]